MSFFSNLEVYHNRVALITKSETLTYSQLVEQADSFSFNFDGKPLVFILCTNTPASIIGYLGCLRRQAVPLLISSAIDDELLDNLCKIYSPEYVWAPLSVNGFFIEKSAEKIYSLDEYRLYRFKTDNLSRGVLFSDLALLLMTSGSTGSPLLVRVSYRNLISNTEAICESLSIDDAHRPITTLPMNYTYGLSIINTHLNKGASIILTEESVISKDFWQLFRENNANSLAGVPYTYQMLFRLGFDRLPLSNVLIMTQAGGKLEDKLVKFYAEKCCSLGIDFIVMYGQTEATARMSYLPVNESINKAGSIGLPIKGGRFKIIDIDSKEITEPFVSGELIYYGDNVTLGYAACFLDLCKADENQGVLSTGDIAYFDNDGYYFIAGRKKRFLKVFGNRISLDEVESLLKSKGYHCFVVGEDNKIRVCSEDKTYSPETVLDLLSNTINIHKTAIAYHYLEQVPRNEFGKVQYAQLNNLLTVK